MNTINQNIVPTNAPRKVVLQRGFLYRFGYEQITGSGLCKCGEILFLMPPTIDSVRDAHNQYCQEKGLSEVFTPADYGFNETE